VHRFSSSPILTKVVIFSNPWAYVYSTGVKINLSSFGESIDLVWCAMILLLYFFLLDLDKTRFWRTWNSQWCTFYNWLQCWNCHLSQFA
jgi:hypothetical protein